MPKRAKLTSEQLAAALETLEGWEVKDGKLHRRFQFADFVQAWGFMTQSAFIAEKMDHHPEWFNVYGIVNVDLMTHDAGGITALDVELAQRMSALA